MDISLSDTWIQPEHVFLVSFPSLTSYVLQKLSNGRVNFFGINVNSQDATAVSSSSFIL